MQSHQRAGRELVDGDDVAHYTAMRGAKSRGRAGPHAGIGSQPDMPLRSVPSAARVLFRSVVFDIPEIFEGPSDINWLFGLVI